MDTKTLIFMKKFFVIAIICNIQLCLYAQDVDTLIDIKGYYVTSFVKQEIIFAYEQKMNKELGLPYSYPIDYKQFSFFIPVQVDKKIICDKEMVFEKMLSRVQNDTVYVIPNTQNISLLKSINIIKPDISAETFILSNAMLLSPYYEIIGNDSSLFHCTFIEGYAQYKHIRTIDKKWQNYLLNICFIDKKTDKLEFFFIVKINKYTPYIELPQFKKWLPYLE